MYQYWLIIKNKWTIPLQTVNNRRNWLEKRKYENSLYFLFDFFFGRPKTALRNKGY